MRKNSAINVQRPGKPSIDTIKIEIILIGNITFTKDVNKFKLYNIKIAKTILFITVNIILIIYSPLKYMMI